MKSVRVKNFRCFHDEQRVPLAPLTLLVGDNSTGKTSFMGFIHAMNGIMEGWPLSRLWGSPFHFGSFEQVVFDIGKEFLGEDRIDLGFEFELSDRRRLQCDFVIKARGSAPDLTFVRFGVADIWVTMDSGTFKDEDGVGSIAVEVQGENNKPAEFSFVLSNLWGLRLLERVRFILDALVDDRFVITTNTDQFSDEVERRVREFRKSIMSLAHFRSYAGAPIRSKPRRTYDLIPSDQDAEGEHIMAYLAELSRNNKEEWLSFKEYLQGFGKLSGLFDEIVIENYGGGPDDPFQVYVRVHKAGTTDKLRNMIDVGYGVNQIIPVVAELRRLSDTTMFLLQQPEIHLHPIAQAALGSFFCDVASWNQQLIIETHSDHLLDRVRMEVRDKTTKLTSDDVLVLFFERVRSDVKIHPIRFDEDGNVVGAPSSYREFFMEETNRSIGW